MILQNNKKDKWHKFEGKKNLKNSNNKSFAFKCQCCLWQEKNKMETLEKEHRASYFRGVFAHTHTHTLTFDFNQNSIEILFLWEYIISSNYAVVSLFSNLNIVNLKFLRATITWWRRWKKIKLCEPHEAY